MENKVMRTLLIKNLYNKRTVKNLKFFFSKYGNVENCYLYKNRKNTYGFVTFSSVKSAYRALKDQCGFELNLFSKVKPAYFWLRPDNIEQQLYCKHKWNKAFKKKTFHSKYIQECYQSHFKKIPVHILNDDCLKYIFSFLPIVDRIRIERVCKHWQMISRDSWHTMKMLNTLPFTWGLSYFTNMNVTMVKKVLLKCGKYLREIKISNLNDSYDELWNTIASSCPNLTSIHIRTSTHIENRYSNLNIELLEVFSKNVTKFSLYLCMPLGPLNINITDLLKIYSNLEYLSLGSFEMNRTSIEMNECLLYLPISTLHTLKLEIHFIDEHISAALKRLKNLKHLELSGKLLENTINVISTNCTNLTVLKLYIDNANMLYFTNLTNLEVLKIISKKFSDTNLIDMALYCQQLLSLSIAACRDVTDKGLEVIKQLPKLEKLDIEHLRFITGEGLGYLHNLKKLKCCNSYVTDKGVSSIIMSLPKLQLLDLTDCEKIRGTFLTIAKQICNKRVNNVILKIIMINTIIDYPSLLTEEDENDLIMNFRDVVTKKLLPLLEVMIWVPRGYIINIDVIYRFCQGKNNKFFYIEKNVSKSMVTILTNDKFYYKTNQFFRVLLFYYKSIMTPLDLNKLKKRIPIENLGRLKKKVDRFDGLSEEEVQKYTLEDYLEMNLDLVFVGINPSLMAAHRGRYYAGPGNHFYKLLYESGLTPRLVSFEEDYKLLEYSIGLTNIVTRATRSAADLKRTEIKEGAKVVEEKLKLYKPKIAVFNGKCIYEVFANITNRSIFHFGLQPERINDTAIWVTPSSSARCAHFPRMTDKLHFYTALKKYLRFLNGEIIDIDVNEFCFEGKCKQSIPSTSKMWRRKNISTFLHGGRVVNKNTLSQSLSEEDIAAIRTAEFVVQTFNQDNSNTDDMTFNTKIHDPKNESQKLLDRDIENRIEEDSTKVENLLTFNENNETITNKSKKKKTLNINRGKKCNNAVNNIVNQKNNKNKNKKNVTNKNSEKFSKISRTTRDNLQIKDDSLDFMNIIKQKLSQKSNTINSTFITSKLKHK